jgi:hypothetical protein
VATCLGMTSSKTSNSDAGFRRIIRVLMTKSELAVRCDVNDAVDMNGIAGFDDVNDDCEVGTEEE